MIGTLANTATVIVGSLIGLLIKGKGAGKPLSAPADEPIEPSAPGRLSSVILQGLGLATIAIGVKMTLDARQMLIVILSMVLGGLVGQLVGIEEALERLAERLKRITRSSESTFVAGLVTASVLFCAGPMTILGSIQDGLHHDAKLLLIKSLMDGISSIILASTLGVGVIFSAVTVLVIQGALSLLASRLQFLTQPLYLGDFTAVGGLIIIALGIRLTGIKNIRAGNFLPALVFVVLLVVVASGLHWRS